ncbi:filamentous haemagglutinin family protein [Bordetella genomosp. 13]|uniref:Filamentous haemagglutinin FhaB/tRNA nuclease CdiA-like TPS domain-containing protein n=1 Tax=Bordetella genomosp. 13 TaxID=463040 RepID=A0A1W6ZES1_9BORD|nr:filamentous haemagglutinin family protein [Bordetella genomosp. 13]ARP95374.1 hypothetical protein CAL15_13850 [Bordetella genomosp. 13]
MMRSSVPQLRPTTSASPARYGESAALRLTPVAAAMAALLLAAGAAAPQAVAAPGGGAWFAAQGQAKDQAGRSAAAMHAARQGSLQAQRQQAQTQRNLQRSLDHVNRSAAAIAAHQAAQRAARDAANAAPSDIPDGLAQGGLEADAAAIWLNAQAPTQRQSGGRTEVTIRQTDRKAILNWKTFNVSRDTTVRFDQSGGNDAKTGNTWSVLNRIDDPSGKPSRIAGQIQAEGAVYLVNRNGVVFHGGSQVNVRTLIASSLKLTDDQFMRGIAAPNMIELPGGTGIARPQFGESAEEQHFYVGEKFVPGPAPGSVSVEAGALLTAHSAGKVMLFGPKVRNAGEISAPDGQVILAAGENVFLKAPRPEDPDGGRGLDVAVAAPAPRLYSYFQLTDAFFRGGDPNAKLIMDTDVLPGMRARAAEVGYEAVNTGMVSSDRGNITMQSLNVTQGGVLQATTALNNRNGSIVLRAWGQGTHARSADLDKMSSWDSGTLTLASGSVTRILPDAGDTGEIELAALATRYEPGRVTLYGKVVDVRSQANVWVPAGNIDVQSAANAFYIQESAYRDAVSSHAPDGNRIYIDAGAFLGVGGLRDVSVPMERNFIEAEFRINELRDSPLLRESWLRGQKVVIDRRAGGTFTDGPMAGVQWVTDADGKPVPGAWVGTRLGDMSGWVGVGATDLQELSTQGGSISLVTQNGDVITRAGSFIDVSGGSVRYAGGLNTSTVLQGADGRYYRIGSASPDMVYVGVAGEYVREHARWNVSTTWKNPLIGPRYEPGYAEGRDAGSLEIKAGRNMALEGDLWGGTIAGDQRADSAGPAGGSLVVGGSAVSDTTWSPGRVYISAAPTLLPADFTVDSPENGAWFRYLSPDETGTGEDASIKQTWLSDSVLSGSGLGEINLFITDHAHIEEGARVELAPGASLVLSRVENSEMDIHVAGTLRAPGGRIVLDSGGGVVTLAGTARLDVAGEWINARLDGSGAVAPALDGGSVMINGELPRGPLVARAGSVIDVSGGGLVRGGSAGAGLQAGDAGSIVLGGVDARTGLDQLDLRAHAAGSGGSLQLLADADVQIGGAGTDEGADADTLVLPATLYGERGFRSVEVQAGPHRIRVPEGVTVRQRPASMLLEPAAYVDAPTGSRVADMGAPAAAPLQQALDRAPAQLTFGAHHIEIGAGASLTTDARGSLTLASDGLGGSIAVHGTLEAPAGVIALTGETVRLHSGAQLLSRGAAAIYMGAHGRRTGQVLGGGKVSLSGMSVDVPAGALIDVSGAAGWIDAPAGGLGGGSALSRPLRLASDAGSISISGTGTVAGRLVGHAGGPGAAGGTLQVDYAVSGAGEPALLDQILEMLRSLDPDCYGLAGNGVCAFDDPWEAVGIDWAPLVRDGYGVPVDDPMIITREFLARLEDVRRFAVSERVEGPKGLVPPLDPADFGLTPAALDMFRDYLLSTDVLREAAARPGQNYTLALRPSAFADGGFADLGLNGGDKMPIEIDPVNLTLGRSISLNGTLTSTGAGEVLLRAPYVSLSGGAPVAPATDGLSGRLSVEAALIDVAGVPFVSGEGVHIAGFEDTLLQAQDLRLGSRYGEIVTLTVDGRLTMRAGQVYPATAVRADVRAGQAIRLERLGEAQAPLSAGGTLRLEAPVIEHAGVLRAPAGQIVLAAGERLGLEAGSITSVSSAWTVPYGTLSNNEYWLDPALRQEQGETPSDYQLAAPPEKRILFESPEVSMAHGSLVDISGGGDLHAWEFVPGPGGSHDVLAQPGMYAVLPGYRGVSPVVGAAAGAQVWLAGGSGLQAGWYTLLPARYALLPGAYAVQSTGRAWTSAGRAPVRLADGGAIAQGRLGNAAAGTRDALDTAWRVMPGSVVRRYTEYNEAHANVFFASDAFKRSQYRLTGQDVVTPRLPRDGGAVVFKADRQLVLDGGLQSHAAPGGRGGMVDIASRKIAIVGPGRDEAALRADGYLIIDARSLTGFGAGSLLVGGMRQGDPLGTRVDVTATDILVRNGADSVLSGPEIILAASDELAIAEGSRISVAQGSAAGSDTVIVQPQRAAVYTDPDGVLDDNWDGVIDDFDAQDDVLTEPARDWGALVRLSSGSAARVVRTGVDTGVGGRVSIGADVRLDGGAALLIDATRTTDLAASARLAGDDLSVASGRIGFGGPEGGMVLDQNALAQLARSRQLTLRSYSTFDFHESVDLSGAGLQSVVLDGAQLVGHGAHDVRVAGGTITLQNLTGTAGGAATAGGGTLTLEADRLVLAAGEKSASGLGAVVLAGKSEIVVEGGGTFDAGDSALTLRTPMLTASGAANHTVRTRGALQALSEPGAAAGAGRNSLGASLALSGGEVMFAGRAGLQGGVLALTATRGDLVVADGAHIAVGGSARAIYDQTEYADAGRVELTALAGDVRLQPGSLLDLAAHPDGGNAGRLAIVAEGGGTVALDGAIHALAGRGGLAGAFSLDIDALPDFGGLATRLNEAGFARARHFRVREGDVVIDGLTRAQDFVLTADRGAVLVRGSVDARAPYGGSIRVTGGDGVATDAAARLLAGSTGELGSGRVTLEAAGGWLDAGAGLIDVAGGEGGVVRLRAPRTADNHDLSARPVGVRVDGARLAVLEGMRVYLSDTVEAVRNPAVSDALDFADHASAIAARVGGGLAIMPGIEIRSDDDLSMRSDWNLYADLGAARAGSLTLRAAGNLNLTGHLSDGFDIAGREGSLQTGDSWSLRLVAGADLASADVLALRPMALLDAGQGAITLGTVDSSDDAADGVGNLVRTGTGDLIVRAGRDLRLVHKDSAIYTAGRRDTTTWSDFTTAAPDAVYGVHGGHVDVIAQGNVEARHSGQRFVEWLKRQGNINEEGYFGPFLAGRNQFIDEPPYVLPLYEDPQQSSWWIDFGGFRQGVGALGGGNVSLAAGGDLDNLVVALATNMRMRGGRTATETMRMELRNGGAMTVDAGGAIRGGQYYVARGAGRIDAGETAIGHRVVITHEVNMTRREYDIAPVLALGDAELTLRTSGDLRLQAIIDPLLVRPTYDGTGTPPEPDELGPYGAYMSGYTDRTSLRLVSTGGDVTLVNQADFVFRDVTIYNYTTPTDDLVGAGGNLYPALSRVVALDGALAVQGPMYVMPAARQDLGLLAQQDLRFENIDVEAMQQFLFHQRMPMAEVILSAATPAMLPSPYRPAASWGAADIELRNAPNGAHHTDPRLVGRTNPSELPQAADFEPSRIYSAQGSITGLNLDASEQTWVRAGRDIRSFNVQARNVRASDVTLLEAGNDIVALQPVYGFLVPNGLRALGPGLVLLSAGRDVYAGDLEIQTLGNQYYDGNNRPLPNTQVLGLPQQGAAITVMAGMNQPAAYDAFAQAYLDPAYVSAMPDHLKDSSSGALLPIYLTDAVESRAGGLEKTVRRGLVSYVAAMTGETLEPLAAWQRFGELPALARQQFLRQVFLHELRDAGRDQNHPGADGLPRNGGYNRGHVAIDALFPGDQWRGDVAANSLSLRTQAGGDIQVLTPGGGVQVAALGATIAPGAGLVTLASGHINIYAHEDVTVNRSRILSFVPETTRQGSDQIIWSTRGDIDAGRGAKTVRVPSAPDIVTDDDGNTRILERSDMSGSGIGTVGEGDVDLVAPEGTINFGDAGVRVAGNFNVAALHVLNAANLQVQGETTGMPEMVSVNVGALTAASSASTAAASTAQDLLARQRGEARRNLPSVISVQILGFGAEPSGSRAVVPAAGASGPADRADPLAYRTESPVQVVGDGALSAAQLARLTPQERRRFGL